MIFLLIYLVFAILAFVNSRSKIIWLLLYILLYIVTVHTQFGYDMNNIRENYDTSIITRDAEERSPVFHVFLLLCSQSGIQYQTFRIFQFFMWATSIALIIRKFSIYPALVVACCFFFPLEGFGCQIRNGIMTGIIYLGFLALFSVKGKWGKFLYVLIITLAGTIHYLAFIYLVALLAYLPVKRIKIKKISILLCILAIIIIKFGQLFGFVSSKVGGYYEGYFTSTGNLDLVFIILAIGLILNSRLSSVYGDHIISHKEYYSKEYVDLAIFVPRFNYILLATMPLLLLSGSFYRIFQNVFLLTAILAFNASYVPRKGKISAKVEYLVFYFFVAAFYIYWQGEFLNIYKNIVF